MFICYNELIKKEQHKNMNSIEQRKNLLPKKKFAFQGKDSSFVLNSYKKDKTVYTVLHRTLSGVLDFKSDEVLIHKANNANDYNDFINTIESVVNEHQKNITTDILIKSISDSTGADWINKDYLPKAKAAVTYSNTTSYNKKSSGSQLSILALLHEDENGNSILSELNYIEPGNRFKSDKKEIKCFIRRKNESFETAFSVNENKNVFSNWEKGPNAINGAGASSFFQKFLGLSKEDSDELVEQIKEQYDLSKITFDASNVSGINFKNANPMPFNSHKKEDINAAVEYISSWRGLNKTTVHDLFKRGCIEYANLLRVPLNEQTDAIRKNRQGAEYSINEPKKGIKKEQFYFPLFDAKTDNKVALQFISMNPEFQLKMNYGSTYGVYNGITHKNADRLVISEAAFDNFALYEMMKFNNIDIKKYNLLSCQSVGGIDTYLLRKFGISFEEDVETNTLNIFETDITTIQKPLNDSQISQYKKEFLKSDSVRKFILVYDDENTELHKKLKLFGQSVKAIDSSIPVEYIKSNNRFINSFNYNPLDIVIDSTSVDTFLSRNSLAINSNGYFEKTIDSFKLKEISAEYIKKIQDEHNIKTIISACDNDDAGLKSSRKLKLFAKTFNLNYADWRPNHPLLKDHNEVLKTYKGINKIEDLNIQDKRTLLSYINEKNISPINNDMDNKKKLSYRTL
jgi:hypothetical protein